jgi:hypothetical protein
MPDAVLIDTTCLNGRAQRGKSSADAQARVVMLNGHGSTEVAVQDEGRRPII